MDKEPSSCLIWEFKVRGGAGVERPFWSEFIVICNNVKKGFLIINFLRIQLKPVQIPLIN